MIIVLDANAAIRFSLGQTGHEQVAEVLKKADWVVAPSLYFYEIANVMWKYYQAGTLSQEALKEKTMNCAGLIDELLPAAVLYTECFDLACRLSHPAYDMAYLAACQKKEAGLISFDRKMLEMAQKLSIVCYP